MKWQSNAWVGTFLHQNVPLVIYFMRQPNTTWRKTTLSSPHWCFSPANRYCIRWSTRRSTGICSFHAIHGFVARGDGCHDGIRRASFFKVNDLVPRNERGTNVALSLTNIFFDWLYLFSCVGRSVVQDFVSRAIIGLVWTMAEISNQVRREHKYRIDTRSEFLVCTSDTNVCHRCIRIRNGPYCAKS